MIDTKAGTYQNSKSPANDGGNEQLAVNFNMIKEVDEEAAGANIH